MTQLHGSEKIDAGTHSMTPRSLVFVQNPPTEISDTLSDRAMRHKLDGTDHVYGCLDNRDDQIEYNPNDDSLK